MNLITNIVCPISTERIDSNVSRLSVFTLVILMITFLITFQPLFLLIVVIDYTFRATGYGHYSLLTRTYAQVVASTKIKPKMTDKAQKVFAARLGWLCSFSALILFLIGFTTASLVVVVMLATLSTMDSIFNLCVGCLIYNYLVYPFYTND